MPRTRQLPDLFRPRYSRLALPARRPEKWPIQALFSWIHSLGEIVGYRRGGVSVTAEINAYRERINSGMEKRSSRGPSSICVEKAINPECLPGSDIRVDSVGCRGFRRQMTALRHGHRWLGQTGRDPKPPTSPLHPRPGKVGFGLRIEAGRTERNGKTPIVRQAFTGRENYPVHFLGAQALYRVA